MSILNGQSLLSSAMAGLSNTYATLMSNSSTSGKGLTLDDLTNVSSTTLYQLGSNYTFLQYLTSNFASLDNDGDGELTGTDLNKIMNTMQTQGLTYSEIQTLCASGNCDSSLYSTVLQYFNQIDSNGDGRVTSEEITKFTYDCQREEALAKYKSYRASETSLYYNDGVEDDTSSVLDSLRPNLDNSSSNS
ncbi:TPA: EF-hand domain-containing protein [Candidatus Avigastranaerophilus faecigallinarum]|nr:EF-hand domain-containing protein [Candidatus Avigastranaerophilus faecigallinarum]